MNSWLAFTLGIFVGLTFAPLWRYLWGCLRSR